MGLCFSILLSFERCVANEIAARLFLVGGILLGGGRTISAQTLYTIGDPSNEEQLHLELINRARANPTAEGVRLAALTDPSTVGEYSWWPVDLTMMQSEFAALSPLPPLAFNKHLNDSAEIHSQDMLNVGFQGHASSSQASIPNADLGQRANAAGYSGWTSMSESVYSYGQSPEHVHASFEVDWGPGAGWMQTGRPHRANTHSASYPEVGIGVVHGTNGAYGSDFVTQDFGIRPSFPTFVTGVVYYDIDGDGFYDIGEGIGGVEIQVVGAAYYAVSSASGGYAIPIRDDGAHTISFELEGLPLYQQQFQITSGQSAKVDWTPAYDPPELAGPSTVTVGLGGAYTFGTVGAAEGYDVQVADVITSPAGEGAESGSGSLTIETTSSYAAIQSDIKRSGSYAFHLAHASTTSPKQIVTIERSFVPRVGANVRFFSRLRAADDGQWAKVELSSDDGASWQDIWLQRGTIGNGESAFSLKTVDLASYLGRHIKLRFSFMITPGYIYTGTSPAYGWFFDDIVFNNMDELSAASNSSVPTDEAAYSYHPTATGTRSLFVRAQTQGASLPWSSAKQVIVAANNYANWASRMSSKTGQAPGSFTGMLEDLDGDGLVHAYEYALEASGYLPTTTSDINLVAPAIEGDYIVLDYALDTGKADAAVAPVASSDLAIWYRVGEAGAPPGFEDYLISSEPGGVQQRRARVPLAGAAAFLRLSVVITAP